MMMKNKILFLTIKLFQRKAEKTIKNKAKNACFAKKFANRHFLRGLHGKIISL